MSEIVRPLGQSELFRPTQPHDHNQTCNRVERRIAEASYPCLLRPHRKTSRAHGRNRNAHKSASRGRDQLAGPCDRLK